jgi:hypothetical protein
MGHLKRGEAQPQPLFGVPITVQICEVGSAAFVVVSDCGWRIRRRGVVRTVGIVIEVANLTKRYGSNMAGRDLSFEVLPGHVTGSAGPRSSVRPTLA